MEGPARGDGHARRHAGALGGRYGEDVTVVFEQPPRPPIRSTVILVTHAPRPRRDSADDEIIRLLRAEPEPGVIRVVTSDVFLSRPRPRGRRERRSGLGVPRTAGGRAVIPRTRYARSGDASIAYQVVGDGGLDLLFLTGWITQIEHLWEAPANGRFLERLAAFGRLILFDSRGTGLSERVLDDYTVEQEVEDALAVLDAAGSERSAVLTYALGGLVGAHLAAEHPERIGALIMYASTARTSWAPDYDWAMTVEEREEMAERNIATWGEVDAEAMAGWAPSMADRPVAGRLVRADAASRREPHRGARDRPRDDRPRRPRPAAPHPGADARHAPAR